MRRSAFRLLVALLTFTCGIAATFVWLELGRATTALPAPPRMADAPPCFPTDANGVTLGARCTHAYFPPEKFGLNDRRTARREQSYKVEGYSAQLALMNEPSLLSFDDCEGEVYRFTWLRWRWLSAPVAIRVWRVGDRQFLAVKQLGVANACWVEGLTLDGTVRETVRPLSAEEWTRFVVLLNETAYWSQPTLERMDVRPACGLYDADWLLEGVRDCRYYVVERNTPGSDISAAGRYLLTLSGLDISPERVY